MKNNIFESFSDFLNRSLKEEYDSENRTVKHLLGLQYEKFINALGDAVEDPKVVNLLKMGKEDGLPNDEKIDVQLKSINVSKLLPTQNQIGLKDSFKLAAKFPESLGDCIVGNTKSLSDKRVLVANGKYILDGHHRWSQVYLLNSDADLPCVNLVFSSLKNPETFLRIIQMGIGATYNKIVTVPADSDTDIFNMSEDKIRDTISQVLGANALEVCKDAYGFSTMDEVFDKITANAIKLKQLKPNSAPNRKYMPQPAATAKASGKDTNGFYGVPKDFIDKLADGSVNYKEPFSK